MAGINALPQMHERPLPELRLPRERMDLATFQKVGKAEDLEIPGPGGALPLRVYHPRGANGSLPLVLVCHGGGFVFGNIDGSYDHVCRVLCEGAQCRVISVGYRLAPEDKFPAAPDDVYAALKWAAANANALGIDTEKIFVAGGSAGANLAAVTALRARDLGELQLRGQVLFYPMTTFHTPATASSLDFAKGYYLTRADVVWFLEQYFKDEADRLHPYAMPLSATSLAGLPSALIVTAEFDPLRDEGEQYARRLASEGVDVTLSRYDGMVHGFLAFPTDKVDQALQETIQWLRMRLDNPAPM